MVGNVIKRHDRVSSSILHLSLLKLALIILRLNPRKRSHWSAIIFTFPKFSLILGGVASGKSRLAESLVRQANRPRTYIATAQAFDSEMEEKIKQHQLDRGPDWSTIEAPIAVPEALAKIDDSQVVLIDCMTLWLSNLILSENCPEDPSAPLLSTIRSCNFPIVTVSNEVGHSVIPDTKLGRRFQKDQGRLNAKLAAEADLVVMVTAGIPKVLKGRLPANLI
ncbi:MAG: bifunctional adenosylcobinamide kinase/adenosylcobinamide-phosphate guanylyltransferase [Rhodobacteraceae bacterium]|nr:bifunctional adenosylcobinamide kinase/adenosylcobinamide-phosphate guanylyltransferase [Paracoccaceae bacterium]